MFLNVISNTGKVNFDVHTSFCEDGRITNTRELQNLDKTQVLKKSFFRMRRTQDSYLRRHDRTNIIIFRTHFECTNVKHLTRHKGILP